MALQIRRRITQLIDDVASVFARVVHIRRNRPSVTAPDVGAYALFPREELFPEPDAPRDMRETSRWRFAGLHCSDLTFRSTHRSITPRLRGLHEGSYAPNATTHARWLRHTDGRVRPTALFLHSWMDPGSVFEETVVLPAIARTLDVDVLRLQLPYHGRRLPSCSRYHGEYFWTADLTRTFEAIRQSVTDARALLRWLEFERGAPVGVIGQSLGGIVALAMTAAEPRLAFSVPIAAHLDLAGVLEDASLLRPMALELQAQGWSSRDVAHYMESVGLSAVEPAIPVNRIHMVAGRYDRFLTAPRIEHLWNRWGQPAIHWFEGGHLGIYYSMPEYLRTTRRWLSGQGLVTAASDGEQMLLGSASTADPSIIAPPQWRAARG